MKNALKEQLIKQRKLMGLLEGKRKNDYNCVMLFLDFPKMNELTSQIEKSDIYEDPDDDTFGIQKEPHVTLLFGLHEEVKLNDVTKILDKYEFGDLTIHNASIFENEQYDVLKLDVKRDKALFDCNKDLMKFPHTTDYPDYHPHLTISYLKPGKGKKYVDMFKDLKFVLIPEKAVYSLTDGSKHNIKI